MAGGEIKIETKAFLTASEEIGTASTQIMQGLDAYLREFNSLRSSWQGSSSDRMKGIANSIKTSGDTLKVNMENYRKTLNELAGIYEQSEKAATESGKSLSFGENSMR